MVFLLTLVGMMAVGYLLWRAFGPALDEEDAKVPSAKPGSVKPGSVKPGSVRRGPVGPDDDPDFLMDLDRRARGTNGSDPDDI